MIVNMFIEIIASTLASVGVVPDTPGGWVGLVVNGGAMGLLGYIIIRVMPDQSREHRDAMHEQAAAFTATLDKQAAAWREELHSERLVHEEESKGMQDAIHDLVLELRSQRA